MERKKHYFMTCFALLFLGLIVAKPGSNFYPAKEKRECKLIKGRMECETMIQEYQINTPVVQYQYE